MTRQARGWDEIRARLAVQTERPALAFAGIPLEYWREEVQLGCAVSLRRLARICVARGADYEKTIAGLR
jgi:hypothetical protein